VQTDGCMVRRTEKNRKVNIDIYLVVVVVVVVVMLVIVVVVF
jgi:hypothetical protein